MQQFTINWQNLNFVLPKPVMYYIGGCDPKLEWAARGISGYEEDRTSKQQVMQSHQEAEAYLQTPAGQKKLTDFLNESLSVLHKMMFENDDWLGKFLNGKKLIFVVGALRTGGTFLFTELCKMHGIDWTRFNQDMIHDGMPLNTWWQNARHTWSWLPLAFEFAQFLVWMKRECSDQDIVIQKNFSYGLALDVLDKIVGSNATYLITTRHPATTAQSIKRYLIDPHTNKNTPKALPFWHDLLTSRGLMDESQWQKSSYLEKAAGYWLLYYKSLAAIEPLAGQSITIAYGNSLSDYIKEAANLCGHSDWVDSFKSKDPDPSWLDAQGQEICEQAIDEVTAFWQAHKKEFPQLSLL